jgi:hypothetical protein
MGQWILVVVDAMFSVDAIPLGEADILLKEMNSLIT